MAAVSMKKYVFVEFPKWVTGPDGSLIINSAEEERAITGIAENCDEIAIPTTACERTGTGVVHPHDQPPPTAVNPSSRPKWHPGQPVITPGDHAQWQAWRRERILQQQRARRKQFRRIDYYPSGAANSIIDRFRSHQVGGDASSILNRIVSEWAEASGIK